MQCGPACECGTVPTIPCLGCSIISPIRLISNVYFTFLPLLTFSSPTPPLLRLLGRLMVSYDPLLFPLSHSFPPHSDVGGTHSPSPPLLSKWIGGSPKRSNTGLRPRVRYALCSGRYILPSSLQSALHHHRCPGDCKATIHSNPICPQFTPRQTWPSAPQPRTATGTASQGGEGNIQTRAS